MVRGRSQEEVGRLFSGSTNIYIVSTCTTWKMSTKGGGGVLGGQKDLR